MAEDAKLLQFFEGAHDADDKPEFQPNVAVAALLDSLQAQKYAGKSLRPPEVFTKSLAYAQAFRGGAIATSDTAAIDELTYLLRGLSFERTLEDGTASTLRLHEFQVAAFCNLNPPSVDAARAIVPGLEPFGDEEVAAAITVLRHAAGKYAAAQ